MAKRSPLAYHWCFTINNYEDGEERLEWLNGYDYCVAGREVAPDTGTPHLQGYVKFTKQQRLSAVKKIHKTAHWEISRGTPQQAADYCKKDGNFVEKGILPKAKNVAGGEATADKYKRAYDLAKKGDLEEIEKDLLVKHYNTFKRIRTDNQPKIAPIDTLEHEWHYGPSRTGKSSSVRRRYPDAYLKDTNHWWDGYNGEDVVIIEDVDKYDVKLGRYLKLWGDHYAFPADMKNQGKLDIRPKKVIVTSNYTPREIWDDDKTSDPIMRRYKLINYYDVQQPESSAPRIIMSEDFHRQESIQVDEQRMPEARSAEGNEPVNENTELGEEDSREELSQVLTRISQNVQSDSE